MAVPAAAPAPMAAAAAAVGLEAMLEMVDTVEQRLITPETVPVEAAEVARLVIVHPQTAVVVRDGFSYVYTVGSDQKVGQLKVQTGRQSGDRVEVTSGLKADARVVASGGAFLNHGDTVRVVDTAVSSAFSAAPATK